MLSILALAGIGIAALSLGSSSTTVYDQPIAEAWPIAAAWTPRMEDEYAQFVEHLGDAVEARACRGLWSCLRDPYANLLWDRGDIKLELPADCADLPYLLRAYFAFKRRLPFSFVSEVEGEPGRDLRYTRNLHPVRWRSAHELPTLRAMFRSLVGSVHTGMFRMGPEIETSDFYPVAIDRRAVRPGAIFYDPNGHASVVARRTPEGSLFFLNGHPDGSLTWSRFGEAMSLGSAQQGGGFLAFRPLVARGGQLVRVPNRELPLLDSGAQHDRGAWTVDGIATGYHAWVRATLREVTSLDPAQVLRDELRALCRDVAERIDAVDAALAAGLQHRPHPATLPDNIYGTDGDWELYSTPSRDARLKAAVREISRELEALPAAELRPVELALAWRQEVTRPECSYVYQNSRGEPRPFTIETVIDRLFELSFDPYHCVELRWGAPVDSPELATCPDGEDKLEWYRREQRLRQRIDRDYGSPTPLDAGPLERPELDPRRYWGGGTPRRDERRARLSPRRRSRRSPGRSPAPAARAACPASARWRRTAPR